MSTNREFLKRLRAGKSSFYLADFHVHSPASDDFMGPEKVDSNVLDAPEGAGHLNGRAKHEAIAISTQPPDVFYDALVAHRNSLAASQGIHDGEAWAFVAVTDHDVCRNSVRLANYAWASDRLRENRLVILPGIELSVEFTVPSTSSIAAVHLLLVFCPLTGAEQIYAAIRDASQTTWEYGESVTVEDLPKFVARVRNHDDYPAICIAAHIGSCKGVREETKKCILSHLEAEITRAEGELQTPDLHDRESLQRALDSFKQKRSDSHAISLDVLQLIGSCGFDALQTRGARDESFYRRLHRFRDGFGRSVSIVCSDAHEINRTFLYTDQEQSIQSVPFIKLSTVSSTIDPKELFDEIRGKALKFGETRSTYKAPEHVTSWIEGVEIIPDAKSASTFWPFDRDANGNPIRFTVQFSRNLNCVIGGRGSGKSALIEAVAFVCSPDAFSETDHQDKDWYQRAAATLQGCQVRLVWRSMSTSGDELPRRALFLSRYFDINHKHKPVECLDLEGKELLAGTVSPPSLQVFRIHDIEETTKPELLRSLFDAICGDDIRGLSNQIEDAVDALASHRLKMVDVARRIALLTREDGPLRQYARRKHDYDEVNKPEIQKQYEKIDEAAAAEKVACVVHQSWQDVEDQLDLASYVEVIKNWFANSRSEVLQPPTSKTDAEQPQPNSCRPLCDPLFSAIEGRDGDLDEAPKAESRIVESIANVQNECNNLEASLDSAKNEIEGIHREARESLANKGFPTGSAERQTKKSAFEEAESDLNEYRLHWDEWDRMEVRRQELFKHLQALCKRRTGIRKFTADRITQSLASDLDPTILRIDADAQPVADVSSLQSWLMANVKWSAQHKSTRFQQLAKRVTPETLRRLFLTKNAPDEAGLIIDKSSAALGRITAEDAKAIVKSTAGFQQLEGETVKEDDPNFLASLPLEVREGLWTFPTKAGRSDELVVDAVLMLDEVILDDLPVIRLNDRPAETSVMKPLDVLSPGQRCSAILPILLLNGTSPLVIDQPEDNLDNRLIRQVIVNVLSSIKLKRQVIVATHNPNLPVLGDAEQVIVLRAVEDGQCRMEAEGDLEQHAVVRSITEIMEGGREAFQYRHVIYREYWEGGAEAE